MLSSFLGMYWLEGLRGDGIGSIGVGCNGSKGRLGSICGMPAIEGSALTLSLSLMEQPAGNCREKKA